MNISFTQIPMSITTVLSSTETINPTERSNCTSNGTNGMFK